MTYVHVLLDGLDSVPRKDRNSFGGGVIIYQYTFSNIRSRRRNDLEPGNAECIWVQKLIMISLRHYLLVAVAVGFDQSIKLFLVFGCKKIYTNARNEPFSNLLNLNILTLYIFIYFWGRGITGCRFNPTYIFLAVQRFIRDCGRF